MTTFNELATEILESHMQGLVGHIDIDYDHVEDCNANDMYEYFSDRVSECEIIGYCPAAEYLLENDPSLHQAMRLADGYGLEVSSLSSEVLANLVYQQELRESLPDFEDVVAEIEEARAEFDEDND